MKSLHQESIHDEVDGDKPTLSWVAGNLEEETNT
jgi:hypothetical protein